MNDNNEYQGIFLNYPETHFYPAGTYSDLDTVQLEWPKTNTVLRFYLAHEIHFDDDTIPVNADALRAEAWEDNADQNFDAANHNYEWALRKGLDMTPEDEALLTSDDWEAIRAIVDAARKKAEAAAESGQRGLWEGE